LTLTLTSCGISPTVPKTFKPISSPTQNIHTRSTRRYDSSHKNSVQLGVHAAKCRTSKENDRHCQELEEIQQICSHNAKVCAATQEDEKREVWELLALMVEGRRLESAYTYDGWSGSPGAALSTNLVAGILRYYESLGDVQMLSTMVCVLRGKQQQQQSTNRIDETPRPWNLLPPSTHANQYDMYLRVYGYLLYAWGQWGIRTELLKHMVHALPYYECYESPVITEATAHKETSHTAKVPDERSAGYALAFVCPRCGKEADLGVNYCRTCQDYAFRCVICDTSVRGLLTMCES
jgi:predicted RNA-binding Zn-ribbon protein involved in translation (DUF1610 family)